MITSLRVVAFAKRKDTGCKIRLVKSVDTSCPTVSARVRLTVHIVSETQEEHPFTVGMDIQLSPPYAKQMTEQDHKEATVNLFGQLLQPEDNDGGRQG